MSNICILLIYFLQVPMNHEVRLGDEYITATDADEAYKAACTLYMCEIISWKECSRIFACLSDGFENIDQADVSVEPGLTYPQDENQLENLLRPLIDFNLIDRQTIRSIRQNFSEKIHNLLEILGGRDGAETDNGEPFTAVQSIFGSGTVYNRLQSKMRKQFMDMDLTMDSFAGVTAKWLRATRGIGKTKVDELRHFLADKNIYFKDEQPSAAAQKSVNPQ